MKKKKATTKRRATKRKTPVAVKPHRFGEFKIPRGCRVSMPALIIDE